MAYKTRGILKDIFSKKKVHLQIPSNTVIAIQQIISSNMFRNLKKNWAKRISYMNSLDLLGNFSPMLSNYRIPILDKSLQPYPRDTMVIIVENGHCNPSSNPERDCI